MAVWTIPSQLFRSITAGVRPSSLLAGQLFLNQTDGVLCWPDGSNAVRTTSLDPTPTVVAPTTGTAVTLTAWRRLVINPAGTLAALTVTLPASPVDAQMQCFFTTQALTALTVNGGTLKNTITTLAAGGSAGFMFVSSLSAWVRVQ